MALGLLLPLLRLRHEARLRLVALKRLGFTCKCGGAWGDTRAPWGKATLGVRAGGALCFFLDMPKLSATEPRKDRMPSRPSPAVQLRRAAGRGRGELRLVGTISPLYPLSSSTLPHGRLRTLTIAKVNTYTGNY